MKKIKKLIAIMMVAISCFTMFDYSVLQVEGRPNHNSYTTKKHTKKMDIQLNSPSKNNGKTAIPERSEFTIQVTNLFKIGIQDLIILVN